VWLLNKGVRMKKSRFLFSVMLAISPLAPSVFSRSVPAFVSVEWLAQNLNNPTVVVIDIRSAEQYQKGHIPGAVSAPFSAWAIESNNLSLELPPEKSLQELLGKLGIKNDSVAVIVNRTDTDFSKADAMRVAWTCIMAGLKDSTVLDGGYSRWLKNGKAISAESRIPLPTKYDVPVNLSAIASKSYVLAKIGKSVIADNRTPEDYFGVSSSKGHIKSAVNLPAPWAYAADGTLRKEQDLQAMAEAVIGRSRSREIIVYCEVGGFASTWWFLLTQILGYQNVKLYDGSTQEWFQDASAPATAFSWH
jgi:thiosulfate/3-mercaptopyruvate sulfurtransferase